MFIRPSGNKSHNRSPSVVLVHKFNVKEDLMSIGNRAGIYISIYILKKLDFCMVDGHCIFVLHSYPIIDDHHMFICLQPRCLFLFTTAWRLLLFTTANTTQILTPLLWTTLMLMKPQLNEDIDWKESLMLKEKPTKLQSKMSSVKGKKENQRLENLPVKQLLSLSSTNDTTSSL